MKAAGDCNTKSEKSPAFPAPPYSHLSKQPDSSVVCINGGIWHGSKDVTRDIGILSTEISWKRGDGLVVDEGLDERLEADDS